MEDEGNYSPEQVIKAPLIDLRQGIVDVEIPNQIRVDGSLFSVEKWEQMIADSQTDGHERSIFISTDPKGNPRTSKVRISSDSVHDVSTVSSPEGFLPHGLYSLIPGYLKPLATVHTHPMVNGLEHLPTSLPSEQDIRNISVSAIKVSVILDSGGVHFLMKRNIPYQQHNIDAKSIVDNAYAVARQRDQSVAEVRQSLGEDLARIGYFYYYSPSRIPAEDNSLTLSDSRVGLHV